MNTKQATKWVSSRIFIAPLLRQYFYVVSVFKICGNVDDLVHCRFYKKAEGNTYFLAKCTYYISRLVH